MSDYGKVWYCSVGIVPKLENQYLLFQYEICRKFAKLDMTTVEFRYAKNFNRQRSWFAVTVMAQSSGKPAARRATSGRGERHRQNAGCRYPSFHSRLCWSGGGRQRQRGAIHDRGRSSARVICFTPRAKENHVYDTQSRIAALGTHSAGVGRFFQLVRNRGVDPRLHNAAPLGRQ